MLKYRPDIDGLRAVAVLSVVFYHAGLGFPGGYVGVDVFFVISGYLITGLILKDLERGTFSLANFWERRIRRIFPALAVMVAATMVAGWFLLLPDDLAKLGASVIAQSLMVSNFYFWRTTNYFGGANEEKPLLHTWSLAVEEQFYLILPIALMAFWWAWSRWQKAQADRILGTTNHTNFHEKVEPPITQIDTDGSKESGLRLAGQAGDSESDSLASELADSPVSESLIRSADTPSSLPATSYSPPVTSPVGDNRRWTLFWIFAAIALLSFVLSIWGVKAQPFATFFLLPTRAWELLLGSMLAALPATVVVRSAALRELLCLAGLAGILVPVFFYSESTPFPGLAAIPPCLGTAMLIWANTSLAGQPMKGMIAKVLSLGPVVFIGLISYSLYLWHWPIFAYGEYLRLIPNSSLERLIVIAAVVLISIISWRYVEKPFRKGTPGLMFKRVLAGALRSSLLLILGAAFFIASDGGIQRFSGDARLAIDDLRASRDSEIDHHDIATSPNPLEIAAGNFPKFGQLEKPRELDLLIWGDSHAAALVQFLHEAFQQAGLQGGIVFNLSTPPLLGFEKPLRLGLPPEKRPQIANELIAYIRRQGVKNVLLVGYWSEYQHIAGESDLRKCLEQTVAAINAAGAKAWIATDWPDQPADPNRVLIFSQLPAFIPRPKATTLQGFTRANSAVLEFISEEDGIRSVDLASPLLNNDTKQFEFIKDGKLLYQDANHLTVHAIRSYLGGNLKNFVEAVKERQQTQ